MSGAEDARLNAGLKKESKLSVTEEEHNVQSRQEAGWWSRTQSAVLPAPATLIRKVDRIIVSMFYATVTRENLEHLLVIDRTEHLALFQSVS